MEDLYVLHFAIHNRGLLHCNAVPEDDELEHFLWLEFDFDFSFNMHGVGYLNLPGHVEVILSKAIPISPFPKPSYLQELWGNKTAAFGNRRPRIIPMRSLHEYIELRRTTSEQGDGESLIIYRRLFELVTAFQSAIDRDDPPLRDATARENEAIAIMKKLYRNPNESPG